jgi:hypothetical protein
MTSVVWSTRQGHRRIEHVPCVDGTYFKVTDPRTVMQAPDVMGWVPVFYRTVESEGKKRTVFSQVTVNGLAVLGVDIADIVAAPPTVTPPPMRVLPRTTRQPGETANDVVARRYRIFWQEFRADMDTFKARAS